MSESDTGALNAASRLREWSQEDIHLLRSVRFHEPVYANPSELRADVRALLAELDLYSKALARLYADEDSDRGFLARQVIRLIEADRG